MEKMASRTKLKFNPIRARRKELEISQEELARMVGRRRDYINNIENGRVNPSLKLLARIATALGCKVRDLLEEE